MGGPFDLKKITATRGAHFMGDYMGLAATGPTFQSLFVPPSNDPSNANGIFTTSITP